MASDLLKSNRDDGRILYAVAVERVSPRPFPGAIRTSSGRYMRAYFEYIHAKDRGEAILTYMQEHLEPGTVVGDVAPVIGYFAEEQNGKLIVTA